MFACTYMIGQHSLVGRHHPLVPVPAAFKQTRRAAYLVQIETLSEHSLRAETNQADIKEVAATKGQKVALELKDYSQQPISLREEK